jgi:hypothetical protein
VQAAGVQRAPVAACVTVRRGGLPAAQNKCNQDGCICMPEEKGLEILLQRADVDVNGCGGCSRAAAPSLQLRAAGEEVPAQLSTTERA